MELITPHSHPEYWAQIPGIPNSLGKDICVQKFIELSSLGRRGMVVWTRDQKQLPAEQVVPPTVNNQWLLYARTGYMAILEPIRIPEDCFGELTPRGTLLRLGILMSPNTDWLPGYQGAGRALIMPTVDCRIEVGLPLFSFKMFRAQGMQPYQGSYQELL